MQWPKQDLILGVTLVLTVIQVYIFVNLCQETSVHAHLDDLDLADTAWSHVSASFSTIADGI